MGHVLVRGLFLLQACNYCFGLYEITNQSILLLIVNRDRTAGKASAGISVEDVRWQILGYEVSPPNVWSVKASRLWQYSIATLTTASENMMRFPSRRSTFLNYFSLALLSLTICAPAVILA